MRCDWQWFPRCWLEWEVKGIQEQSFVRGKGEMSQSTVPWELGCMLCHVDNVSSIAAPPGRVAQELLEMPVECPGSTVCALGSIPPLSSSSFQALLTSAEHPHPSALWPGLERILPWCQLSAGLSEGVNYSPTNPAPICPQPALLASP